MATEVHHEDRHIILTLDAQEVTEIVGLLVAQLAGKTLPGNMAGACPTLKVVENGVVKYRLSLIFDSKP